MKTLIVLFAAIAFAATSFAQNRIIVNPQKDSVLIKEDRIWHVKLLTTVMTTENGTIVMPNGSLKAKDGQTTQLKNGDYVDEDGNVATLDIDPVPTKGFTMNDGKLLLITGPMKSTYDEYIRKDDGKFWTVKFMTNTMTKKNGTTVMVNGMVKTKDGKTFILHDHDGIDENGNQIKVEINPKAMNCMYMHNGKMMYITELKKDTTLKSGIIVRTDGTVKATNGNITNISDGGMVPVDGSYIISRTEDK
jgi:hypothetical protein